MPTAFFSSEILKKSSKLVFFRIFLDLVMEKRICPEIRWSVYLVLTCPGLDSGPSPPERGNDAVEQATGLDFGSSPPRRGNLRRLFRRSSPGPVHPRRSGELSRSPSHRSAVRTIPTCMGKFEGRRSIRPLLEDHPRRSGETCLFGDPSQVDTGPSPPERGNHDITGCAVCMIGPSPPERGNLPD